MVAVMQVLMNDRKLCNSRPDFLTDFILLREAAQVDKLEPGSVSSILGSQASIKDIKTLHDGCDAMSGYMLSQLAKEISKEWHTSATSALSGNTISLEDPLVSQLRALLDQSKEIQRAPASLLKQTFCQLLLSLISRSDEAAQCAECWLPFSRRLQTSDPDLAGGIFEQLAPFLEASPVLQRVQLQLASDLSGVKATDANVKGEPLLRLLMSVAPSASSSTELLPQQRAVFLVKSLQSWLLDDLADDLNDAVLDQLVRLLAALAPSLQDIEGSHWDFSLDIVETILEVRSAFCVTQMC